MSTIGSTLTVILLYYSSLLSAAVVTAADKQRKGMEGQKVVLYVGTYTANVESPGEGIYAFELQLTPDFTNFSFSELSTTKVISPTYLAVTNNKKYLLAVSETEDEFESKVHSYKIAGPGKLEPINSVDAEGTYTCYVSTDSKDKFAYVANYFGGVATAYSLDAKGTLTRVNNVTYTGCSGVQPDRQEAPHVHMIHTGPSESYVYITDLGNDRIARLKYDPGKGFDENSSTFFASEAGAGPRHFVFHPNARYLYVSAELSNTVHVYAVHSDGSLKLLQVVSSLPGDYTSANKNAEIRISADGKYVYVVNRGHDSIAIFATEDDGAKLDSLGFTPSRGKFPRNFDLLGNLMVVANQNSGDLTVFKIQPDGQLSSVGQPINVPSPVRVKIFAP